MFSPLRELLGSADVLTLHVPLVAGIRLLIGEPTLRLLQPHAVIVNTARGGLIDEPTLARALAEGCAGHADPGAAGAFEPIAVG
jgi:phosphoglycerate dehydrogenase-like enzyme